VAVVAAVAVKTIKVQPDGVAVVVAVLATIPAMAALVLTVVPPEQLAMVVAAVLVMRLLAELEADVVQVVQEATLAAVQTPDPAVPEVRQATTLLEIPLLHGRRLALGKAHRLNWRKYEQRQIQDQRLR